MPSLQNPVTVLSEPWRAKTRTGGDERSAAATFAGASALVRPGSEASPGPPPPLSTLLALGDRIWGMGAGLGAAMAPSHRCQIPQTPGSSLPRELQCRRFSRLCFMIRKGSCSQTFLLRFRGDVEVITPGDKASPPRENLTSRCPPLAAPPGPPLVGHRSA